MCGNCNCGRGSVFCLDERMIFILLLIFLFVNCGSGSLFSGLLGGCGCGCDSCGNGCGGNSCGGCGCQNNCGC